MITNEGRDGVTLPYFGIGGDPLGRVARTRRTRGGTPTATSFRRRSPRRSRRGGRTRSGGCPTGAAARPRDDRARPGRTRPRAGSELDRLERGTQWGLLDAIDAAITGLAADPGAPSSRQRSFAGSGFGIMVRTRDDDWLVVWEHDQDVIAVRYIGPDPFGFVREK
jgi:hypothetical protein